MSKRKPLIWNGTYKIHHDTFEGDVHQRKDPNLGHMSLLKNYDIQRLDLYNEKE